MPGARPNGSEFFQATCSSGLRTWRVLSHGGWSGKRAPAIDRGPDPGREPQPEETASQMVDRIWEEAVRDAMKNGLEAIRTDPNVAESQPVRK